MAVMTSEQHAILLFIRIFYTFFVAESTPEVKYKSVLFGSLRHFLSELAMFGIQAAANCFKSTSSSRGTEDVFSPKEIDEYNRCSLMF